MPPPGWYDGSTTTTTVTVFRGRAKFCLKASWAGIGYDVFVERLSGGRPSNEPASSLVLSYCQAILEELAPDTTARGLTLESFVRTPAYYLQIIVPEAPNDTISVIGQDRSIEEPSYYLLPIPTSTLSCRSIPRIPASNLILPSDREELQDLGSLSGEVSSVSSGEVMFFKAREAAREREFDRELDILIRLKELNQALAHRDQPQLRVSELRGIVVAGHDGEQTTGLVMTRIKQHPAGIHVLDRAFCGRYELHEKWKEQVTTTVSELHQHGVVWGDVNPCNIVIDNDLNAWVIDFGGNFNWEFVDKEHKETMEGDWQGLDRLFGDWLASRRLWPSGDVGEISTVVLSRDEAGS